MSIYTWPPPGQDEGSITGVRLADQIRARVGSQLDGYNFDTAKDAALAELLGSAAEVFDVRAFGAKGDGVTNDTVAIQAAIVVAATGVGLGLEGSIVTLPPGQYAISSDLEIPIGVMLRGGGSRCTRIKWIGGSPVNAVLTSNLNGEYGNGFNHSTRIIGLRVDANGAAVGALFRGWNESCRLSDFEIFDVDDVGLALEAVTLPTTNLFQHASLHNVRIVPNSGASVGLRLRGVRRCFLQNVTVDQKSSATGPVDAGFSVEQGSDQNVFVNCHAEDCSVPFDIGKTSQCVANVFVGCDFDNPHAAPNGQTIGSITDETVGALIRTGSKMYTFQSFKDGYGFDHLIYDVDRDLSVAGVGSGGGVTYRQRVEGYLQSADYYVDGTHSRRQVAVSVSSDAVDVADRDSLAVSTTDGDVVIGGLTGGVLGQVVTLFKKTSANRLIIEHNESAGTEKIICPRATDLTFTDFGGAVLEFDGTSWFVVQSDGNRANGTATLANGNTTVVVTHGLGVTPGLKDITVTPSESWGAFTKFWKHTPTSTQFTIEVDQDPGQDVDFSWTAAVQ